MVLLPKEHLKDITRTPEPSSRRPYLRLDLNEGIPLPDEFLTRILAEVTGEYLAMYPEYRDLKRILARHHHIGEENILLSNGSDAAIKYIFEAYINSGDRVLLTDPTFAMNHVYCGMYQARAEIIEYHSDFSFPFSEYINRLDGSVRMAILVNPNNPTGTLIEKKPLMALIESAYSHDILMVIDEAYHFTSPSVVELVKDFPNLIVIRSFSKLWGASCMRLGYAVAQPSILEQMRKVKSTYDVNGLATLIACRLLENPALMRDRLHILNEGKSYLMNRLKKAGIPFLPGTANFILIQCGERSNEYVKELARDNILVAGNLKPGYLSPYIRVTISHEGVMKKFWKSFIRVHTELQKKGMSLEK